MYKYNFWSWYKKVIVKNIKTGEKSETTISKQILRRRNLKVGDYINDEEYIIKIIDGGEKKVKKAVDLSKIPYFETKVVKVKKEECQHEYKVLHYRCIKCGEEFKREADIDGIEPKLKGNWVNGENLDKIKFPCFCSYSDMSGEHYGMIITNSGGETFYDLIDINEQDDHIKCAFTYKSLKELIEKRNIHILKGKIIIFEEE